MTSLYTKLYTKFIYLKLENHFTQQIADDRQPNRQNFGIKHQVCRLPDLHLPGSLSMPSPATSLASFKRASIPSHHRRPAISATDAE